MTNYEYFKQAYIVCMLWSSLDDQGDPIDSNYSEDDISEELMEKINADTKKFFDENEELMRGVYADFSRHGHDFWLTRVGHGAGFWDRGYGDLGELLSEKARAFGDFDIYIGDDDLVYGYGC